VTAKVKSLQVLVHCKNEVLVLVLVLACPVLVSITAVYSRTVFYSQQCSFLSGYCFRKKMFKINTRPIFYNSIVSVDDEIRDVLHARIAVVSLTLPVRVGVCQCDLSRPCLLLLKILDVIQTNYSLPVPLKLLIDVRQCCIVNFKI